MKCKSCGFDNEPSAKFCSKCGQNLITKKTHKCPQCHGGLSKDDEFCPHCGLKLEWVEADYDHIPVPIKDKSKQLSRNKQINNKIDFILSIVFSSLIIASLVIILFSCFGNIVEQKASLSGIQYSTKYTFSEYMKELFDVIDNEKAAVTAGTHGDEYLVSLYVKMSFVITTFTLVIVGGLISLTFVVIKFVNGILHKNSFSSKASCFGPMAAILFIGTILLLEGTSSGEKSGGIYIFKTLGDGTIAMLVGVVIYLVALLTNYVRECLLNTNKKNILINAFAFGAVTLSTIGLLIGFNGIIALSEGTVFAQSGAFPLFLSNINTYSSNLSLTSPPDGTIEQLIAFILAFLALIGGVFTLFGETNKKYIISSVSSLLAGSLLIPSAVISVNEFKKTIEGSTVRCSASGTAITAMVFLFIAGGLFIASSIIKKQMEKEI